MNNTTIATTVTPVQTTSRKFKCIGLKESHCLHWSNSFTKGDNYHEAKHDRKMEDNTNNHQLLLVYKKFYPFYVDKTQFKLLVNT